MSRKRDFEIKRRNLFIFSAILLAVILAFVFMKFGSNIHLSPASDDLRNTNIENVGNDITNTINELGRNDTYSKYKSDIKGTLDNDFELSEWLQSASKLFFNLDQEISLSQLIILLSYFIIMIFFASTILEFTGFSGMSNKVLSIGLPIIAAVTGLLQILLFPIYGWINSFSGGRIISMLLLFAVALVIIGIMIRMRVSIRRTNDSNRAGEAGMKAGFISRSSELLNKTLAEAGRDFTKNKD